MVPSAVDYIKSQAVLYPPQVIPCGIHGMEGGIPGILDGSHGMSVGTHTIFRVESIWNEFTES
jgi:hypothetical protein